MPKKKTNLRERRGNRGEVNPSKEGETREPPPIREIAIEDFAMTIEEMENFARGCRFLFGPADDGETAEK